MKGTLCVNRNNESETEDVNEQSKIAPYIKVARLQEKLQPKPQVH